jgi:glycosyltransferase involved in cell wall biosynthesis
MRSLLQRLIEGLEAGEEADARLCLNTTPEAHPPRTADQPAISVILPTHNRTELLARCLEGFASQTVPRDLFEVIVLDDGSDPPALPVAERFRSRLRLVCARHPHAGLSATRNAAIARAAGRWLALHDDDDVPAPDYLERCLAFHREHPDEADILLARVTPGPDLPRTALLEWIFSPKSNIIGFPKPGVVHGWHSFYGGTSSCKRSLFRHGLYDPVYRFGFEDMELALRLNRKVRLRVHYDPAVVSYFERILDFPWFIRRCYREGRSFRRFYERQGKESLVAMPGRILNSPATAAALEPRVPEFLRFVQRVEAHGLAVPDEFELEADGHRQRGFAALKLAYTLCARFGRAKGWVDFSNRTPEEGGLQAIDAWLEAFYAPGPAAKRPGPRSACEGAATIK